ncbi:unnamed protein product [Parajaminaea phylloscopi]
MSFYNATASASSSRRPATSTRKPVVALNVLPQSDGSASFGFGQQISLASLIGPTEVRIRDELTDRATLDITALPLTGVVGIAATSFANGTLQRALASVAILERYPRSLLQLTLQTTNQEGLASLSVASSNAGSRSRRIRPTRPHPDASLGATERAAHINAAMLALMQGGIACSATVCAVAVAHVPRASLQRSPSRDDDEMQDDSEDADSATSIVVDPSPQEELHATSIHLFAFACSGTVVDCDVGEDKEGGPREDTGEARLVLVESNGPTPLPSYLQAVHLARQVAKSTVLGAMRRAVEEQLLGPSPQ